MFWAIILPTLGGLGRIVLELSGDMLGEPGPWFWNPLLLLFLEAGEGYLSYAVHQVNSLKGL